MDARESPASGADLAARGAQGRPQSRIALIGCGAIGSAVLPLLRDERALRVTQIVVPSHGIDAARAVAAASAPHARILDALQPDAPDAPDLVVECAGHGAVAQHVLGALRRGTPAVLASVGALHDAGTLAALGDAAAAGGARVHLIAGAVGGIDALAAARIGGLSSVQYVGRKPPQGWRGTPAEALCDLDALKEPFVLLHGSARDAARLYPKNANVAAIVSLAGLGFDATQATLIADPSVTRNVHRIVAEGAFGRLDLMLENAPLAANPKTSALTVFSIVRAIRNATDAISI